MSWKKEVRPDMGAVELIDPNGVRVVVFSVKAPMEQIAGRAVRTQLADQALELLQRIAGELHDRHDYDEETRREYPFTGAGDLYVEAFALLEKAGLR